MFNTGKYSLLTEQPEENIENLGENVLDFIPGNGANECCPLRNKFLGCVEIVLKILIFIIHVTYLYDESSSEGPEGPNF